MILGFNCSLQPHWDLASLCNILVLCKTRQDLGEMARSHRDVGNLFKILARFRKTWTWRQDLLWSWRNVVDLSKTQKLTNIMTRPWEDLLDLNEISIKKNCMNSHVDQGKTVSSVYKCMWSYSIVMMLYLVALWVARILV